MQRASRRPSSRRQKRQVGAGRRRAALGRLRAAADDRCLTFREWCQLNGIGERTGRRILASGNGPVVTQLTDKRIGITVRANREWQAARAR